MLVSDKECKKLASPVLIERYRAVIERYRESKQEPQAFIIDCLKAGTVTVSDAAKLVSYLTSGSMSRSFALADLSDDSSFRLALYETSEGGSSSVPLFVVQLDQSLRIHSEELSAHLEVFAHKVAELSCAHDNSHQDGQRISDCAFDTEQDILNSILVEAIPEGSTCH